MGVTVFHVIDSAEYGGGERYLLDLIRRRSRDVRHAVLLPHAGPLKTALDRLACPCAVLPMRRRLSLPDVFRMTRQVRRFRPNVIHSHGFRASLHSRLAATCTRTLHVCTVHVSLYDYVDTPVPVRGLYMLAERCTSVLSRRFFCISNAMAADTLRMGIPRAKIRRIPNGVDLERFGPNPKSDEALRRLGLSQSGPVIGTVGRMVTEKGQRYLVDAVAKLAPSFPNLVCLFVGQGPLRSELEEQAGAHGVKDRCRFTGALPDMENIYPVMDLFVLPSLREPFGLTLLEAMASKVAVVATQGGGPPDFIRSEENGVLVPSRDADALAGVIERLLKNPKLRTRFARAAFDTVHTSYDVRRMVAAMESEYRTIAAERTKRVRA